MQIKYRIFNDWAEIGDTPDSRDFIYRQSYSGKIIALELAALRRLFVSNTKLTLLKLNAILLAELERVLKNGQTAGSITL